MILGYFIDMIFAEILLMKRLHCLAYLNSFSACFSRPCSAESPGWTWQASVSPQKFSFSKVNWSSEGTPPSFIA